MSEWPAVGLAAIACAASCASRLRGNLFVEELVPSETLFAAALRSPGGESGLLADLPALIRLGGDETIGRGLTHLTPVPATRTAR